MRSPVATAIAIAAGLVVLLGYFVPLTELKGIQDVLLGWAVVLAGFAALVGIMNLLRTHWHKMTAPREGDRLSVVVILAFGLTLVAGIFFTPAHAQYQQVIYSIQLPIEASLMAALAIALAYASLRILQRRRGLMGVVFVLSALVFLAMGTGLLTAGSDSSVLGMLFSAIQLLPVAGARGILLGIAIGSLITGLRILMGLDRPYSG